ncbi:MAG: glycosyltransferase [Flavobacteriaceae bacterium]|nr:glycosyltransferase [Flavobacteriaceae bacterium]
MNNKVSVVIRNKNEAESLERVLKILTNVYNQDIGEIIVVDNLSVDSSIQVASKYNCKIVQIKDFTYGRAINQGIEVAKNDIILLLSSHAIPIGNHFFKSVFKVIIENKSIAGIRFINSVENYERAISNNYVVSEPLKNGIVAACCIINKKVWNQFKFNGELIGGEDKEWSQRVIDNDYIIYDLNETYIYFLNRSKQQLYNRYKVEIDINSSLFKVKFSLKNAINGLAMAIYKLVKNSFIDFYYILKRFLFLMKYILKQQRVK